MKKKLLSVLLATLLLLACIPLSVSAEEYFAEGDYTYTVISGEATIVGYYDVDYDDYDLVIPDTLGGYPVTGIKYDAFRGNLYSVYIPAGITRISEGAFTSLQVYDFDVAPDNPNYSAQDGVLFNKDKSVLLQFPSLQYGAYTVPDGVTTIGNSAFYWCFDLTSVILPDSVTSIGDSAFYECRNLRSVNLPDNLTDIGWYAFYKCGGLTTIVIPEGVTTISADAFSYCNALSSVTIPTGVTSIQYNAFAGCGDLNVYYVGTWEQWAAIEIGRYAFESSAHLYANSHDPRLLFSPDVQHSVMETENGNGLAFRFELAADGVGVVNKIEADLSNATVSCLGETCKLVGMGAVATNRPHLEVSSDLCLDTVNDIDTIDIPAVYLCDLEPDSCAFAVRIINIPGSQLERTIYARPYYVVEVDGEEIVVYGDVDSASCAEYM